MLELICHTPPAGLGFLGPAVHILAESLMFIAPDLNMKVHWTSFLTLNAHRKRISQKIHHQGPDRPELPAFATSLANRMTQIGVDPYAEDFELPLRTWYIAHDTVHRWTAPRILRLIGPPSAWEQQIRIMWIDQIDPTQWFAVTVVEPDPPRPIQHGQVVYDVIIEQALDLPRFAGLVTVLPEQPHRFQFYSVACSLPGRVSGYDLIQAADAGTYCQYQFMHNHISLERDPEHFAPTT